MANTFTKSRVTPLKFVTLIDMQTCLNTAGVSLDDVGVIILPGLGNTNIGYQNSDIADWIDDGGIYYQSHVGSTVRLLRCNQQHDPCCKGFSMQHGWSGLSGPLGGGRLDLLSANLTLMPSSNNGGTLDYSGLLNKTYQDNGYRSNEYSINL